MNDAFWVYMMTNKTCSTLYTGITNSLQRRVWEHKNKTQPRSFAAIYSTNRLVWFELFRGARDAIACESRIKGLTRAKKNAMIAEMNPRWEDLSEGWYE